MDRITAQWSVLDQERRCARCKQRPVAVIFDREQVCAVCYKILDAALVKEGEANVRPKAVHK